jgi:hypothetical protein
MVLFPTKTAADHTFLDMFPVLMMKNARLNFSNSRPSGSCYCQIPDPVKHVAVKSHGYARYPPWGKPQTGALGAVYISRVTWTGAFTWENFSPVIRASCSTQVRSQLGRFLLRDLY